MNDYWLNTSEIFGRGSWLRWVGWQLAGAGHWAGLEKQSPGIGVALVLRDLGIEEPSPQTRSELEAWFAEAQRTKPWAIPANAFVVASMTPDFHVK
jgi:hypothetical protein